MAAFAARLQNLLSRAAQLAAEPDAMGWARRCAWIPGTGHCRARHCHRSCIFRAQREAEAGVLARWRRVRRISRRLYLR
jgi:hypothetical protein